MKINKELTAIRKKLGHVAMAWKPSTWLNTGNPELNSVLGHCERGIAYGRIMEVSGWESGGKTAITLALAALAQRNGAHVIWGDVENSFEPDWAMQRGMLKCEACKGKGCEECEDTGLNTNKLTLIQPFVGTFGKEKEQRLSTAQELCTEIEEAIRMKRPEDRVFVVLDSIAALVTEGESNAGIENANMRTNMELPMFLGRLLRRWVGLAQINNAAIILINQLRTAPKAFGDPNYTPGGNAPRFYSHVRVRVKRTQNSKLTDKGKTVGIRGTLTATKNKTGGEEGAKVGYRLYFRAKLEFVSAKEILKDAAGE